MVCTLEFWAIIQNTLGGICFVQGRGLYEETGGRKEVLAQSL